MKKGEKKKPAQKEEEVDSLRDQKVEEQGDAGPRKAKKTNKGGETILTQLQLTRRERANRGRGTWRRRQPPTWAQKKGKLLKKGGRRALTLKEEGPDSEKVGRELVLRK